MRFKVIEGSQTAHCCFAATVVDTTKPLNRFKGDDDFDPMCECFELEEARIICDALNKANPE